MKSKLLLLAAIALPLCATAQETATKQNPFKVGVSTGTNLSFMRNDTFNTYDPWVGKTIGITAEKSIHPHFSLSSGVYYEQRNFRTNYESVSFDPNVYYDTYDVEFRNHFITVPLTVKAFFTKESSVYVMAGGYASFFLRGVYKDGTDTLLNTKRSTESTNMGAVFGGGYRWKIDGRNELNFELRDNLGLTGMFKNSDNYKTHTIALVVNYQLAL